ncbi:hypothetical protein GCM10008098_06860 [Rhodanobacter panaciterrae]|uniref:Lysozyme inhibitor LprI-like N-terminal domain-containing protein n=1 Tax=Rhodanobacter panaciterrae TaxID=490572 RepID=A0ABQ2ZMW4_9GAMM|nr:lysozyme inhibitor LprI family protein [Rhodanobacter panaciterrae]GGY17753.1 hypothetical protein GCM10008098_06860 [Rhodanobacter panaciterrae]
MLPIPARIRLCQTFGVLFFGTLIVSQLLCSAHAKDTSSTSQVIQRDAPKGITTTFYTCIDKAGSDTVALGACLSAEKTTKDSRLNSTYKTLLGKLNDKAKDKLIIAERTWLKLQGENGAFEDSLYGDEIIDNLDVTQSEIFSICERANTLNRYLSIASGQ